jgi:hypothetical protein
MDAVATTREFTPSEVIDRVRAARAAEQRAAADVVELAAEWARLHPCGEQQTPAHWGEVDLHGEATVPLAGPGAPLVAEFAPLALGAALGISHDAARELLGDALELVHRLPRLWSHARDGRVPVWRARQICRQTRDLAPEAAAYADRLVAATPGRISHVRAEQLVDEARLYFDPDRAVDDETHALARRGVWLRPGRAPATTEVLMTLDTPDALLLDQSVTRIAADLRSLGDADSLDVRRARAAGILADPQYALDLMSGRGGGQRIVGGVVDLVVHVAPGDLAGQGAGAASIERLGAATTELLATWLSRHTSSGGRLVVRPVLDLVDDTAVDRHDPPAVMRQRVMELHTTCAFPGCVRDARGCDLDHITEYVPLDDGEPPGQTRPSNLAPLCRTHHRAKTHSGWRYKRRDTRAGPAYTWTAPTGHQYDVRAIPRSAPARPLARVT